MRNKHFLLLTLCLLTSYLFAQSTLVTLSGRIVVTDNQQAISFANVSLFSDKDSSFVTGTITNEEGRFEIEDIMPASYYLKISMIGYSTLNRPLFVGSLSNFLDLQTITLSETAEMLEEIVVTGRQDQVNSKMDKKTFNLSENTSQSGGSVLQAMQNLPGVTVQDGKILLRGNENVSVLVDGQQSAITGYGNQRGLDNIPSSSIEKIEIINNPSAKYDANGNAGIINIIYKKNNQEGFNGKISISAGLGALAIKRDNLPDIRPQYTSTPKYNPSLSLNYKKNNLNLFLQSDVLYTETLNKNEFIDRFYNDGSTVFQQLKRNRNTTFTTNKIGLDWQSSDQDQFTLSALYGTEKIIDRGDEPFFLNSLDTRYRLWQFLEDEIKTTVVASTAFQHKFKEAGHNFKLAYNYTFHREDEQYFFTNILPLSTGQDAFKLLSDESVHDLLFDYVKPLKSGRLEAGLKVRRRNIPTNMQFFPGVNSPIDANAGGAATYSETIPAIYGNYIFENKKYEAEIGMRFEYVKLNYFVNPDHNTYASDGYDYSQPFPTIRLAYKLNDENKISLFYNRRVDRPNEVDIRIFPKYDDAELIKVGNPALQPQFTDALELAYKTSWDKGYYYTALFHRQVDGTITRIASSIPGSNLLYAIFQNAGKSNSTGLEMVLTQEVSKKLSLNANITAYKNHIDAFTVNNLYPVPNTFSADDQNITSYNIKLNSTIRFSPKTNGQLSFVYLAPDIIPQGEIGKRYSLDAGLKHTIQQGRGELFVNATDLLNTMVIKKEIQGKDFNYVSNDYYETQVIRVGYSFKF